MANNWDSPTGDAVYDADQKLQQRGHTINAPQFIIFGYAAQHRGMRDEVRAQRVLQIVQNQLQKENKWIRRMLQIVQEVYLYIHRIRCGANDRLLQQTIRQIVDIAANTAR